jgi:hypothetical protein
VMATSAEIPPESIRVLGGAASAVKVCGYGIVDADLALDSADRRVTLVADAALQLDRFSIYEVPIPAEFIEARGTKTIQVALAYDPPVRRRRLDYMGVEMTFQMIRGKSLDDVENAYRQVAADEEPDKAIGGACKIEFQPKEAPRSLPYGRKKSTLQSGTFSFRQIRNDYGNTYYLVIRAQRKWAPVEIETQDFGVAVTLSADAPELFNQVSARIEQLLRARVRV